MRSRRRRVPSCRARAGGGKADEADGAHGAHHAGRQRRGDAEDEGAAGQEPEPEAARRFLVEGEQGRRAYQQDRANGHAAFRATEQFSHVAGGVGCMGIGIARAGEDGEALHRCAALQPGALLFRHAWMRISWGASAASASMFGAPWKPTSMTPGGVRGVPTIRS